MNQSEIIDSEWANPDNWSGGFFGVYFSKRDTRAWVPKSIPALGWTLNLGNPAGSRNFICLLLLPTVILGVGLIFASIARCPGG